MRVLALAILIAIATSAGAVAQHASVDTAFEEFWAAETPRAAEAAGMAIVAAGVEFKEAWERLEAGPGFSADVRTGRWLDERVNQDGLEHPYMVVVPESYDPGRSYGVRVYLHGGVARPFGASDGNWWRNTERVAGDDYIAVFPYSWNESLWWQGSQVENINGLLWDLKRTYNIDDNRVYLFGVSDGGTGAWFLAFRDTTPWAAFLPFIAHPAVLSNPRIGADGDLYVGNLRNKPYYVVNGGRDRLYPVDKVQPFMRLFQGAGVSVEFVAKPAGEHNTRWWPDEAGNIEAFIDAAPRNPYPNEVWWRTDRADRYNRSHWVVIDELDERGVEVDEDNQVIVGGRSFVAFPRRGPSGRLEVEAAANDIQVRALGVGSYRLLLSPDQFDFDAPITVSTNGVESFRGMVERDPEVLLRWAARDADRRMLFGAELVIEVGQGS